MQWPYGSLAVWQFGSLAVWQFGSLAVWQFGSLTVLSKRTFFFVYFVTDQTPRPYPTM
jgi:hypothetical protein